MHKDLTYKLAVQLRLTSRKVYEIGGFRHLPEHPFVRMKFRTFYKTHDIDTRRDYMLNLFTLKVSAQKAIVRSSE